MGSLGLRCGAGREGRGCGGDGVLVVKLRWRRCRGAAVRGRGCGRHRREGM